MKKRIRRKLEKQQALALLERIGENCGDCGTKYVVKDREMMITQDFLKGFCFFIKGFHPICVNCAESIYTNKLMDDERRCRIEVAQKFLWKNYSPAKYDYISIDKLAELEKKSQEELLEQDYLYFPIFFITMNRKRYYLKKSYEIYKKEGVNGWFDITVPENESVK